jgi:hypothetical protein
MVVLNKMARQFIKEVRGFDPVYDFTYRGMPLRRMNDRTWQKARKKVGLPQVRVHDLKHTFGRRLMAPAFRSRMDKICWATSQVGLLLTNQHPS